VALARALYGDPPVLILDETNANLDAPGERALVDSIREAKARGRTVIIMAHRPIAIASCDLLLMLDRGVQVDFGPRDEVRAPSSPAASSGSRASARWCSTRTAAWSVRSTSARATSSPPARC